MKPLLTLFLALLLASPFVARAAETLVVYPPVPGLAASAHYMVRIRPTTERSPWQNAFAMETACKIVPQKSDAYFDTLGGWTHAYVNFETAGPVEVEIARVNGQPIRTAAVHPRRHASACTVKEGRVLVRLDKPCLVAVDIDGQMDAQDTGKGYRGSPVHTISLFANPPLAGKPQPNDPGVLTVKPGQMPPYDGPWTTLYFLPGVHDVGLAFPLRANRNYYIPGDAIVYGTLSNTKWADGHTIRIFGLGTLSGARLKHPGYIEPAIPEKEHKRYTPIELVGTTDTTVEGITIADSAYHSLMLIHPYKPGHPNAVKWTKIFTWRANGDGINPFGNTLIEDCFIRTQDDSLYVSGLGIRRTVLWNDANGSSFVLSALPQLTDRTLIVEDCDVIYSRAKWHHWSGGRVFNMRGEGGGPAGAGVIFRNINIEDPRPTLQQFFVCLTIPEPYSKNAEKRKAGDLSGILFQNISIAAPSVLGEPQILWGQPDARIRDLTFENLTLGGKPVSTPAFFRTNDFVEGLKFLPGSTTKP
ncbi:MAG: endo-polygalacturonase [Verrucomicrobiota bacterium]